MRQKTINNELALLKIANYHLVILDILIAKKPLYCLYELKGIVEAIQCGMIKDKTLTEDKEFYPRFERLMGKIDSLYNATIINIVEARSKKRVRDRLLSNMLYLVKSTNISQEALNKIIAKMRLDNILIPEAEELLAYIGKLKQKIVEDNRYLVVNIAQKLMAGSKVEDVVGIGVTGLVKAINLFDVSRKLKFSTYAFYWVQVYVREELMDSGNIKIPLYLLKRQRKLNMFVSKFIQDNGRQPTEREVEEGLGMSIKNQREIERAKKMTTDSLNRQMGKKETGTLGDTIASYDEEQSIVYQGLAKLDDVEKEIIIFSFGLYNQPVLTQQEIGARHNLTVKQIGKIKEKALKKLKEYLKDEEL